MLFSLRGVGFQKQLASCLSCLCYLWSEHFCKVIPLGCLFCVYQSAHMERVTLWTVNVCSFLWLLVWYIRSGTLYFFHSFTLSSTRNNNLFWVHNHSSFCFINKLATANNNNNNNNDQTEHYKLAGSTVVLQRRPGQSIFFSGCKKICLFGTDPNKAHIILILICFQWK